LRDEMAAEAAEEEIVMDIAPGDGGGFGDVLGMAMGLFEKAKANLILIGEAIGALLVLVLLMLFVSKRRGKKAAVAELPTEDFPDFGEEPESESATIIPGSEDETILPGDDAAEEDSADEEETVFMGSDTADAEPDDAFEVPEATVDVSQESDEVTPEATVDVSQESAPEIEIPEDDPMEEFNACLAYEHFDDAESIVRSVLEKTQIICITTINYWKFSILL
jgi:hypothetical protein